MTQTKVGLDQIEKAVDKFDMTFLLVTGDDDTYTVHESASFSYDIDKVFFATDTGSITFAVQVGGSNVTGLGSLSVASAIQGSAIPTAVNDVQIGEDVKIVTSSNVTADMFRVTLHCSRN